VDEVKLQQHLVDEPLVLNLSLRSLKRLMRQQKLKLLKRRSKLGIAAVVAIN